MRVASGLAICNMLCLSLLTGCASTLADVRTAAPARTADYADPADELAACAKRKIETADWIFGQPTVQLTRDPDAVRVSALSFTSMLFELSFVSGTAGTRVEYRRSYHGHGTEARAWAMVEACAGHAAPSLG